MLRPSKLNAGSVDYYESTTERQPVAIGADMTDYYSEGGDHAPRVWAAARSEAAKAATLERLGIAEGEELSAEQVETWFNEGKAPGGEHEQLGRAFVGPSVKKMPVKDEHGVRVVGADGVPLTFEKPNGGTVRGWDMVVAAPKSVSMLHAIGDDATRESIVSAHRFAIEQAMAYLGQHGAYTRVRTPGAKEAQVVPSSALSGVVYEHRTSRNMDPHLHAHVLMHNRVLDPSTGQWVSIDGTSMMHETKAAGTVYQAALRARLTSDLGLSWQPVDGRSGVADLTGLTREQIQGWSTRSGEIDAWCSEHGLSDHAGNQKSAQLETRVSKDTSKSDAELCAGWGLRARGEGISASQIGHGPILDANGMALPDEGVRAIQEGSQASAEAVLQSASARASTFTRADVVQAAVAALSPYQGSPQDVLSAIEELADGALEVAVSLEGAASAGDSITRRLRAGQRLGQREGSIRYTTTHMLQVEASTTTRAARRVAGLSGNPALVTAQGLDLDQVAGMRQLVASDRQASVMVAPAGAGKTTSLKAARAAWERDGQRVLGIAPTGRAAGQMRTDQAVGQADTIATVLGKLRRGQGTGWRPGDVVIVDEAGMVGSFTLARLIEQAEQDQVRMVLVGDPEQLQAVGEASGLFELLAEDLPDTVRLKQVYRQHDVEEREAGLGLRSDASEAHMHQSVAWYAEHDLITAGDRFTMFEGA
ncbi:MAG: relaxase domain-containing protein, partial [Actinomycetota bacterium]|nr:relaxase domain-containing protein [Actinomycetota bacterium]